MQICNIKNAWYIYIYSTYDHQYRVPLRHHSSGRWWIWNRRNRMFSQELWRNCPNGEEFVSFLTDVVAYVFAIVKHPSWVNWWGLDKRSPLMLCSFKLPIGVQYICKYLMMSDRTFVWQQVLFGTQYNGHHQHGSQKKDDFETLGVSSSPFDSTVLDSPKY